MAENPSIVRSVTSSRDDRVIPIVGDLRGRTPVTPRGLASAVRPLVGVRYNLDVEVLPVSFREVDGLSRTSAELPWAGELVSDPHEHPPLVHTSTDPEDS